MPAIGRVLVVPNFFYLRMEELCSWGPSMLQKCFGILPQICALTQSCLGTLRTIPSTSWLGFCSDMNCQLWDLILTGVCLSKIMSNQLNLPQVDSNQVVETSQGWSMENRKHLSLNTYVNKELMWLVTAFKRLLVQIPEPTRWKNLQFCPWARQLTPKTTAPRARITLMSIKAAPHTSLIQRS